MRIVAVANKLHQGSMNAQAGCVVELGFRPTIENLENNRRLSVYCDDARPNEFAPWEYGG